MISGREDACCQTPEMYSEQETLRRESVYIIDNNFALLLTDFRNSFTLGLSSDCVTNGSLKIPSHLIRVATLPCETLGATENAGLQSNGLVRRVGKCRTKWRTKSQRWKMTDRSSAQKYYDTRKMLFNI